NIPSFQIGSFNYNEPNVGDLTTRITSRYVFGMNGKFSALSYDNWTWNAYAQYGETHADTDVLDVRDTPNFQLAINAVMSGGQLKCASTVANPNNGCIPFDPLGVNDNTRAAVQYITAETRNDQFFQQLVFAGTVQGEPASDWAGPISVGLD